jgi:hydroxypyruvate isomerase
MPRFAANISMLFTELPLAERFAAARAAGFTGVEMQMPYAEPATRLAAAAAAAGVAVALINVPPGDMMQGGPGLACVPGREGMFREALDRAVEYARALRPANVNVLAGRNPEGVSRDDCLRTLAANLRRAADAMAAIGVGVTTEAINDRDNPGFLLHTRAEALAAIDLAGDPRLRLQYDFYHMHIMGDDFARALATDVARIGHMQFADAPGRNEPGTGAIDFAAVFAAIDRSGYDGWVGAEYRPSGATADSLVWFAPWRDQSSSRGSR